MVTVFKCGWHKFNGKLYPIYCLDKVFSIIETMLVIYDVNFVNPYMLDPEQQESKILISTMNGYFSEVPMTWYYNDTLRDYLIRQCGYLQIAGKLSDGKWIWYSGDSHKYYTMDDMFTYILHVDSYDGTKGIPVSAKDLNEIMSREGVQGALWTDNHIVLLQDDNKCIGFTPQPVKGTWSVGEKVNILEEVYNI